MGPIDDDGKHMTMDEFVLHVQSSCLMNCDGFGRLATSTKESREDILPSNVKNGCKPPEWATHVVWFNR